MPDPLTPADLEAILRGGGSATDKLQRAATMALEKRAMGKDLLTEEECLQIAAQCWCDDETAKIEMDTRLAQAFAKRLAAAARLGAERERERAARKADACAKEWWRIHCDTNKHMETTRAAHEAFCALGIAIRRGEGE